MIVGPVVEPILSNLSSGTMAAASTPSNGLDYAINDLLFRVRPTNDTQYQRATAQFQKDQLDTGHSAGDQSLTGWWTRGQFSFHKGAGITYYDTGTTVRLNEDQTVLNHFADGEGLDPYAPGKVTCQRKWSAYSAAVSDTRFVAAIGTTLVVLDGTTVKYGNFNAVPSTYVPTGGATVSAVTVSPTTIYAALSNGKIASLTTAGVETTLYTGLTTTIRGIWYVKNRLLVSDSDNKWYQLSTNPTGPPVAVASTDVIFTGTDWATNSCVTTSPGPILIGNSNSVYAATLDSTGSVPTISAPVQVAELPPGERLNAIAYHLGFVILVTGAGVRVGVLADSGQLTYGPLLVERTAATSTFLRTSVARYGTRASVVIDSRIIEIDLSQQVGSNGLEFAWTGRGTPFTGTETAAGVTTTEVTTQIAWANGAMYNSTATADRMAGYIKTGFHRFATLEPKRFDSVRVTMDGTSGTVEVIRVDAAGAELSLFTLDVSKTHSEEIPLGFDSSQQSVGLKFVLTPSAGAPTVSPVLLGYQLRALPDPRRQRMIRVPLLMDDIERRQPARMTGRTGQAWERLRTLEELEDSNSVVTFSDFRTGESGQGYIESIEFTGATPPSAKATGFGGTAFVTLRKLS